MKWQILSNNKYHRGCNLASNTPRKTKREECVSQLCWKSAYSLNLAVLETSVISQITIHRSGENYLFAFSFILCYVVLFKLLKFVKCAVDVVHALSYYKNNTQNIDDYEPVCVLCSVCRQYFCGFVQCSICIMINCFGSLSNHKNLKRQHLS